MTDNKTGAALRPNLGLGCGRHPGFTLQRSSDWLLYVRHEGRLLPGDFLGTVVRAPFLESRPLFNCLPLSSRLPLPNPPPLLVFPPWLKLASSRRNVLCFYNIALIIFHILD